MRNPRKRPFINFATIIVALGLLYLLSNIGSRESTEEKVSGLTSQHKGAIVFLKTYTEKDRPFQKALNEIRPKLKGKAGIITASKEKEEGSPRGGKANLSPSLIIIDAHGDEIGRFDNSIDQKIIDEVVRRLSTHQD